MLLSVICKMLRNMLLANTIYAIIFAAIVTGVTTLLMRMFFETIAQKLQFINDIIEHLTQIEEAIIDYWSCNADKDKDNFLATKLAALFMSCESDSRMLEKLMGPAFAKEYSEKLNDLWEGVTSGKFATTTRKADSQKVLMGIAVCHELKRILRCSRLRQFLAR